MRLWLLLAVSFFCWLSYSVAKDPNQNRPVAKGRRRKGKKMARQGRVPVNGGYNSASVFIESYKGVEEAKPSYNVIPGQCKLKRGPKTDRRKRLLNLALFRSSLYLTI